MKEKKKEGIKKKQYCTCKDSHLCCPKDITTAHCGYCGKPPYSVLKLKKTFDFYVDGKQVDAIKFFSEVRTLEGDHQFVIAGNGTIQVDFKLHGADVLNN